MKKLTLVLMLLSSTFTLLKSNTIKITNKSGQKVGFRAIGQHHEMHYFDLANEESREFSMNKGVKFVYDEDKGYVDGNTIKGVQTPIQNNVAYIYKGNNNFESIGRY